MKIIITENQVRDLIDILTEDEAQSNSVLNNTGLKSLESLMSLYHDPTAELVKRMGPSIKKYLNKIGGNTDNTSTDTTPNIPSGVELMNPLGKSQYRISSGFGASRGGRPHKSVDLSTPSGTPVYAPADGKVVSARDTTPNRCGGFIKIDHANAITKFCHLRKWVVSVGQNVQQGQIIGYTGGGNSDPYRGTSTGPHLHYEIQNKSGIALNPQQSQYGLA